MTYAREIERTRERERSYLDGQALAAAIDANHECPSVRRRLCQGRLKVGPVAPIEKWATLSSI